eukprot:4000641-Ditylum_brightwellii.AAC.1
MSSKHDDTTHPEHHPYTSVPTMASTAYAITNMEPEPSLSSQYQQLLQHHPLYNQLLPPMPSSFLHGQSVTSTTAAVPTASVLNNHAFDSSNQN